MRPRIQIVALQAGHEGGGAPVPVTRGVEEALAAWSPAALPDHVRGGARFVHEHEALAIHVVLPDAPAIAMTSDVRPLLLGRPQ